MAESANSVDWEDAWEKGLTGWHRSDVDLTLQHHLKDLTAGQPSVSVLVTWCGKSVDLPWLCSQGYSVVGIELSELAVKQLFEENKIPYSVARQGEFVIYQAKDRKLKVISGDYYKATPELLGTFEAVWDINAFGAVYPVDREKYTSVLTSLLKPNGRILLCTWEYTPTNMCDNGPFSMACSLVKEMFQDHFDVQYLGSRDIHVTHFIKEFSVDWATEHIHLLCCKNVIQ